MPYHALRPLKTVGTFTRSGESSGHLLAATNKQPARDSRETAFTSTSTARPHCIDEAVSRCPSTELDQQAVAIPGGSDTTCALGRAPDHTTNHMSHTERTSDARRPSVLRHGRANQRANAEANQREKATRAGNPGKGPLVGIPAFSPTGLKRYPARAAALPGRANPSTRRTTSHASTHTTTHQWQRA